MAPPSLPKDCMRVIAAIHLLSDKYGATDDTAKILAVMAAAAPDRPEIAVAQARNMLVSRDYAEARSLLDRVETKNPDNAMIKAMLALCMYIQQDGMWETCAEEALALPDSNAISRGIIDTLAKRSGQPLRGLSKEDASEPVARHHHVPGLVC
ncbi:HrpB1 family type III secretion system apparatus protein [Bordetella muralis]|uniref:HrpB1 family type III secretion system apparatus protein n=1 Tax=Bordetella muralis TaxID=1649130 RepID=UPI0039EE9942